MYYVVKLHQNGNPIIVKLLEFPGEILTNQTIQSNEISLWGIDFDDCMEFFLMVFRSI